MTAPRGAEMHPLILDTAIPTHRCHIMATTLLATTQQTHCFPPHGFSHASESSVSLSIISVAANMWAFSGCCVQENQESCCNWLLPMEQNQENASSVSPVRNPWAWGRSAWHAVLPGIAPAPGSRIPCECQENNSSEMMESKSSGSPVLLRDCFVSSVTSCYGC